MSYTPIKDLLSDLTFDDLFEAFLEVAKAWKLPVDAWQKVEPARGLLSIVSDKFVSLYNERIVHPLRSSFFDFAEGPWLRARAYAERGVVAQDQTQAQGVVPIENRGDDVFNFEPGDVRIKNLNGYVYVNVESGSLGTWSGTGPYPSVNMTFRAETPGSEASTPIDGFDAYPTPVVSGGVDLYAGDGSGASGASPTNASPLVGLDTETDEQIKARVYLAPGTFPLEGNTISGAPATRNAYEAIALDKKLNRLSNGQPVNVSRAKVITNTGGLVRVVLASPTGGATGNNVTPDTDVFVVNANLQKLAVPPGITCTVYGSPEVEITGTFSLTVNRRLNVTSAEAIAAARQAVNAYLGSISIGGVKLLDGGAGFVLHDELQAKASEALPAIDACVLTGFSDTALVFDQVAVLSEDAVFTVTFVTQ